ncbi:arginine--tRNA ligase [Candidatus Woesearchaeota archaeon]|nr:arginine--tRNA ligase [Candidatus Woesearchaeota archaeon]
MDFKTALVDLLRKHLKKDVKDLIEIPPDPTLGDYAFPCFSLAKELKKNPNQIAQDLSKQIKADFLTKIETKGAYLNFFVDKTLLTQDVLTTVLQEKEKYGRSTLGKGKTVVIDMSSPNIAKPFGIGHLRSTIIGNALRNLLILQGYKVIRINHLGDWGTQFGKLIVAFKLWGDAKKLKKDPIPYLLDLYVKFHDVAEKKPELEDEARAWFKKLEDGNKEALALWKTFKDLSLVEFKKVYKLLGVEFEAYSGEAFYNDQLESTIELIKKKGITEMSEGALIVNLEKYTMPPAILRKSDGATLYLTRDVAAALYRKKTYNFDTMLYEVGGEQKLHFQQLFKVLELLGYTWAKDCTHVDHGLYLGSDGKKFSTRKGKTVFMTDVLDETINLAKKIIQEKNPKLKNKDAVAQHVGVGAIIFGDLCNDRSRDILFDIDKFTSFEGETGPYLQYTHARLCSILRKKKLSAGKITYSLYDKTEQEIIKHLGRFSDVALDASHQYKPHILARYLLDLAQMINSFYVSHPVLQDDKDLEKARLALITAVKIVLSNGLGILGITSLEEM